MGLLLIKNKNTFPETIKQSAAQHRQSETGQRKSYFLLDNTMHTAYNSTVAALSGYFEVL